MIDIMAEKRKKLAEIEKRVAGATCDLQTISNTLEDFIKKYSNVDGGKTEKAIYKKLVYRATLAIKYLNGENRKGGEDE